MKESESKCSELITACVTCQGLHWSHENERNGVVLQDWQKIVRNAGRQEKNVSALRGACQVFTGWRALGCKAGRTGRDKGRKHKTKVTSHLLLLVRKSQIGPEFFFFL